MLTKIGAPQPSLAAAAHSGTTSADLPAEPSAAEQFLAELSAAWPLVNEIAPWMARQQVAASGNLSSNNGMPSAGTAAVDSRQSRTTANTAKQASAAAAKAEEEVSGEAASGFVDKLFEQLLANRLGIDKKKMDELKQKIAELEAQKQELSQNKQTDGEKVARQIEKIDQQLAQLRDALEQLVKDAIERMNGEKINGEKLSGEKLNGDKFSGEQLTSERLNGKQIGSEWFSARQLTRNIAGANPQANASATASAATLSAGLAHYRFATGAGPRVSESA